MSKVLKRGLGWSFGVFSVLMTFLPEPFFCFCNVIKEEMLKNISWLDANTCNIILARWLVFLGLFALSVEITTEPAPTLALSGRYVYPRAYITDSLRQVGFKMTTEKHISLRREGNGFADGLVIVAQK